MTSRQPKTSPSKLWAQVQNRQRRYKISGSSIAAFCGDVLVRTGAPACLIGVVFVGPRSIRRLNRVYRGKDYATDVLSFPYEGESVNGMPFLGEIVLSPAVADKQAREYNITREDEIRRLLVHGILHLLGYDHEVDDGKMLRLQNRILKQLKIQ